MDTNEIDALLSQQPTIDDLKAEVVRLNTLVTNKDATIRSFSALISKGEAALHQTINDNDLEADYFTDLAKVMGWSLEAETEMTMTVTYTFTVKHPLGSESHLDEDAYSIEDVVAEDSDLNITYCYYNIDSLNEGSY